jgi:hypothetical protein
LQKGNFFQGGMMSVQATSGSANISLSAVSALKPAQGSAAQEAAETPAVTKAEAAKGDQQAVRKLAAEQQQSAPPRVSPSGVGKNIDLTA